MGETMVPSNGVDLCMETFGERSDPALLLIAGGGGSMDWWEDEFCRRLAAGGRYVIRYDHRDTGRSTSFPPGAPPYTLADLAYDALGLLDALELPAAHLAGLSMGGGLAARLAIEHPETVRSLTWLSPALPGTGPAGFEATGHGATGHGATGHGATGHGATGHGATGHGATAEDTDWADRKTAVDRMIAEVRRFGGPFTADEPHLRRIGERVFDRTADLTSSRLNHCLARPGTAYADRWDTITAPTLILHGTLDPVYPPAVAQALAARIPGARLSLLDGAGHEYPPAAFWSKVIDELLAHTA